jgi:aerobic-type carbon monoxide dehydrogenase small subunit (CoxS/CutS family)
MKSKIEFRLNGRQRTVTSEEQRSLLEVLREDLKLTGAKYGCGEGQCRACTVLIDDRPAQSCLTPLGSVQGRAIETIEGLEENGQLHPVQEAFIQESAMQCGYCVPGMIMSAVSLLRTNTDPSENEITEAMNGNLCRCCGYPNILKAVRRAAGQAMEKGEAR